MSVSRRARAPQRGQSTLTQASAVARGDRPLGQVGDVGGQQHRRLVVGHRLCSPQAGQCTIGIEAAPVALARQRPVAQPGDDRRAAQAAGIQVGGDLQDALLGGGQAVGRAGVDQHALVAHGLGQGGAVQRLLPRRLDHDPCQQPACGRTPGRAGRGRRRSHDGAGAVLQQHVVGDPDGDQLAVDRVDGVRPQTCPPCHARSRAARSRSPGPPAPGRHGTRARARSRRPAALRPAGARGRAHEEGGPEQGVGPGGEHPHRLAGLGHLEVDIGPDRAPDRCAAGSGPCRLSSGPPCRPAAAGRSR